MREPSAAEEFYGDPNDEARITGNERMCQCSHAESFHEEIAGGIPLRYETDALVVCSGDPSCPCTEFTEEARHAAD